tara:strand:- start:100 stop:870 length:771 start_codon:yes stop_codon:yes gene_type:complete
MPKTLCRDCIFAVFNDDEQTSCEIGRLDKYHEFGCTELFEDNESNKKFFVIQDRYCMACRNQDWADKQDSENFYELVKLEMRIKYLAIIFYNDNRDDLENTLSSLCSQEIPPQKVVVIRKPDCNDTAKSLFKYMKKNEDRFGFQWKIQNILFSYLTDRDCIDLVIDIEPEPYYAVFSCGFQVPEKTFSDINKAIYEDLIQFAMLSPNTSGEGLFMMKAVHKFYHGNSEKNIEEKIEEDGCLQNIIPITKICKNFPQ